MPRIKAKEVSQLGETPAEARARMTRSAPAATGVAEAFAAAAQPELSTSAPARHYAAMMEQEGFAAPPGVEDPTTEDAVETTEPPTPTKAMAMIRQLSQEKLQMQTELDAALHIIALYKDAFGELA